MGPVMMEGMETVPGCGMYVGMWLWILLIAGAMVLLVWSAQKSGKTGDKAVQETALDILKKRYASGEIDKEEYEEKKKVIH